MPARLRRLRGYAVQDHERYVIARIAERDGPWLCALAFRLVGDEHLARAVVDESLVSLLAVVLPEDGSQSGPVQDWLVATVHDRAVELARQRRGAPPRPVRTRTMGRGSSEALTAEAAIDLRDALLYALATLPEEERSAIELVYFDGLLASEAAGMLYVSEQIIREHCLNALRHLSASIDLGGPDGPGGASAQSELGLAEA